MSPTEVVRGERPAVRPVRAPPDAAHPLVGRARELAEARRLLLDEAGKGVQEQTFTANGADYSLFSKVVA